MKMRLSLMRAALALILCLTITLAGCSTSWISEAEEIVATLVPASANIVALVAALEGKSVSASDLATIQNVGSQAGADLQLIQSLITAYEQADAATQPGILNQIESAIGAVQGLLQGLLPALHIKDATTQAKITAVVGIVLSEVQSLAALVPIVKAASEAPTVSQGARKNRLPKAVKVPLSADAFVASYNATMSAKTGNAELDRATAGLKIHRHGGVLRWATAGVLK